MKIGLDLVKEGEASAFLSAGNTGAVLAYSTIILRPLNGRRQTCYSHSITYFERQRHSSWMLVQMWTAKLTSCSSSALWDMFLQSIFWERKIRRVGLLSIGEEDGKGNEIVKEAFQMLKASHINFIGNVEGKEVYRGNADVIVCDGFTGNVALKISESLAEMIGTNLKRLFQSNWPQQTWLFIIKTTVGRVQEKG